MTHFVRHPSVEGLTKERGDKISSHKVCHIHILWILLGQETSSLIINYWIFKLIDQSKSMTQNYDTFCGTADFIPSIEGLKKERWRRNGILPCFFYFFLTQKWKSKHLEKTKASKKQPQLDFTFIFLLMPRNC